MNIFYLDADPKLAAQAMCNKHVVKMILESAQLLCTAHHIIPTWKDVFPEKFYKPTHINHPCSTWVREYSGNYCWLALHAIYLCKEYTYRYSKTHASEPVIEWCNSNIAAYVFGYGSEPPQCMPDEYKMIDTVAAYRRCYNEYKRYTVDMRWTRREPPSWYKECINA